MAVLLYATNYELLRSQLLKVYFPVTSVACCMISKKQLQVDYKGPTIPVPVNIINE